MELKICPNGQNKGFGRTSGKKRGRSRGSERKVVREERQQESYLLMGGDASKPNRVGTDLYL